MAAFLVVGLLSFAVGRITGVNAAYWEAQQKVAESFTTCSKNDNSKEAFPEYFQACKQLCNSLYNDMSICVSSISGGSVTCVCEQTESK